MHVLEVLPDGRRRVEWRDFNFRWDHGNGLPRRTASIYWVVSVPRMSDGCSQFAGNAARVGGSI